MGALGRGRPARSPPFGRRVALVARDPGEGAPGRGSAGRRGRSRRRRGPIRRIEAPPAAPSRLHRQRGAARRARGSPPRKRPFGRRLPFTAALSHRGSSRLQDPGPGFPPGSGGTKPRALRSVDVDAEGRAVPLPSGDPSRGRFDPPYPPGPAPPVPGRRPGSPDSRCALPRDACHRVPRTGGGRRGAAGRRGRGVAVSIGRGGPFLQGGCSARPEVQGGTGLRRASTLRFARHAEADRVGEGVGGTGYRGMDRGRRSGGFVRAERRPGGEGGVLRHRRRSVERSGRGGPSRLPERGVSRRRRRGGGGATLPARPCPSPRPGARETVGGSAGGRRAVPHRVRACGGEGVPAAGFPRRGPLEGPRRSGLACRDRRRFRPRRGNGGSPRGGRVACAPRRRRTDFLAPGRAVRRCGSRCRSRRPGPFPAGGT